LNLGLSSGQPMSLGLGLKSIFNPSMPTTCITIIITTIATTTFHFCVTGQFPLLLKVQSPLKFNIFSEIAGVRFRPGGFLVTKQQHKCTKWHS